MLSAPVWGTGGTLPLKATYRREFIARADCGQGYAL